MKEIEKRILLKLCQIRDKRLVLLKEIISLEEEELHLTNELQEAIT